MSPVIKARHLGVAFEGFQALSNVSFEAQRGECLGIIGESGSGKSTILNVLSGLVEATSGTFQMKGVFQYVFQDPYSALHPYHTVGKILGEPLKIRGRKVTRAQVVQALKDVGLGEEHYFRYPHQLSGGQRQRVSIARALMVQADVLLLDEPTSALDVSVQAEILNLLKDLQEKHGFTMVFVSHDLAVVSFMCDTILVMKQGKIVEKVLQGDLAKGKVVHPYTQTLLEEGSNVYR